MKVINFKQFENLKSLKEETILRGWALSVLKKKQVLSMRNKLRTMYWYETTFYYAQRIFIDRSENYFSFKKMKTSAAIAFQIRNRQCRDRKVKIKINESK